MTKDEIRTRTITMGTLYRPYYVRILNAGYPGGIQVSLVGKHDWCQPSEFLREADVVWVVQRRLELAGLQLAEPWEVPKTEYQRVTIRVRVRRLGRKLRPRAYEWQTKTKIESSTGEKVEPDVGAARSAADCDSGETAGDAGVNESRDEAGGDDGVAEPGASRAV
jgi:hypothetical protein